MSEAKGTPTGATDVVWLSDEDATVGVLERAILGLWESIGELTRLRRTHREHYRVTIFGSARIRPATFAYDQVKHLAARLAAMQCEIVTGGGPGLMQAANEGAASVPGGAERSIGIRVELPFEQQVNPFVGQVYEHRTFFSRLHHFMIVSDAFVVVPGGIGTLLELAMAWQLLQVRKLHGTPLLLIGAMWPPLVEWTRQAMLSERGALANPEDVEIPTCVGSADEALVILDRARAQWLASRGTAGGAPGLVGRNG
jgi:uncharacterized protein (TIGR00730 family)